MPSLGKRDPVAKCGQAESNKENTVMFCEKRIFLGSHMESWDDLARLEMYSWVLETLVTRQELGRSKIYLSG